MAEPENQRDFIAEAEFNAEAETMLKTIPIERPKRRRGPELHPTKKELYVENIRLKEDLKMEKESSKFLGRVIIFLLIFSVIYTVGMAGIMVIMR